MVNNKINEPGEWRGGWGGFLKWTVGYINIYIYIYFFLFFSETLLIVGLGDR